MSPPKPGGGLARAVLAGLLVQGGLPGFAVRVADDVLFAVGGVLQRQQRVVGGGQGRDVIQLSLG